MSSSIQMGVCLFVCVCGHHFPPRCGALHIPNTKSSKQPQGSDNKHPTTNTLQQIPLLKKIDHKQPDSSIYNEVSESPLVFLPSQVLQRETDLLYQYTLLSGLTCISMTHAQCSQLLAMYMYHRENTFQLDLNHYSWPFQPLNIT